MKRFLLNLMTVFIVIAAISGGVYMRWKVLSRYGDDPPLMKKEDPMLEAYEDLSPLSEAMIDGNGYLHLPDNTDVEDVTSNKIMCRAASFDIPESWCGAITASVNAGELSVANGEPLSSGSGQDVLSVRFYEKDTWEKYRTQEHYYDDKARDMGLITEVDVCLSGDAINMADGFLKLASIKYKGKLLPVYVREEGIYSSLYDKEYDDAYRKLVSENYIGCIASSFDSRAGMVVLENTGIEKCAADYRDGLKNFHAGVVSAYEVSVEKPYLQEPERVPESYPWKEFTAPWDYPDAGAGFQFSAPESGGTIPQNLLPGSVG